MRGIFLIILISLCIQSSYAALPFDCDNTNDLQADSALDSQFSTTFDRDYFTNDSVINIVVMKDTSYDASNVKGIFFSVFGVETNGSITTTSYGTFPIVTTVESALSTVNSPCEFVTFSLWPGQITVFWKATGTTSYPETIRLCVGIAVTESPITGYLNCQDIRRAQAVTKPDITPGHGMWNSNIDLMCMVTVFPAPVFNWYYNDVMIQNNAHHLLIDTSTSFNGDDDHQSTLSVRNSRTYDTIFNYHCTVTNVLQSTEVRSDNAVLTIGDLPLVLVESPDAKVNGFLEDSLVIKCVFVSYPRPMVVWEKEGIRLDNTSEIVIIPGTDIEDPTSGIIINSRLAFSSLSQSDSGNYSCKAMRGGTILANIDSVFTLDIISAASITFLTPDSIAIVGTYVTLNCQANGIPTPTIRWLNSAGVDIGQTSSISVRVMIFGINTWTCEASNAGGMENLTASITGYITAAGIATPPGDTTVAYRDRASFVCVASGDPSPVVKWYFTETGGTTEIELSGNEDVYDISEASLVIPTATLNEQGSYRCEASNLANTESSSATLTIQIVRPSVQITPASQDVVYNTAHTISCLSSGIPTSVNFITTPQENKVSSPYVITSFNEGNVGLYRCVAVNPANGELAVQSATYSLTPLSVAVTPAATIVDISSSSSITLTCSVSGSPTYTSLNWYHKNPCSEETVQISGTESGLSISPSTLTIIPTYVTNFLPGEYICVAERYSIEFSGSAVLTVTSLTDTVTIDPPISTYNCPDLSGALTRDLQCNAMSSGSNLVTYSWFLNQNRLDPGSDTSRIDLLPDGYGNYRCVATTGQICEYSESAVDGGLSVDIEFTHSTLVSVEESITINCLANGFPTINYSWSKNGNIIIGQTTSIFTIGAVTVADTGEYTCSVNISECTGVMTSSGVIINVIQTSPLISTVQDNIDVELGRKQVLTCQGTGLPTPSYQWYHNSVPIQNAESATYTITSATITDNGIYTCELFSYVDRSFQDISLIYVYQAPIDIQITGQPMVPSEIGDTVVLTCNAVGIPAPSYQWFSNDDGSLLSSDARLEITVVEETEYSCLADNGRGIAQDSVVISIAPEPSNLLIILPVVLSICAVLVFSIMISAVCLMWVYNIRRRRSDLKGEIAGDSNVLLADPPVLNEDGDAQLGIEESIASTPSITGGLQSDNIGKLGGLDRSNPLTVEQLQTVLSTVEKNGGFDGDNELSLDFESTPSNMAKWTTMPKDSEIKNRYMNVLPNQDTMVELADSTGESGSTYINANFIINYKSSKTAYIAAQGPLPSTIVDFWRMVWENDVSAVVMTCLLFERKRIRCARYWPDTQQRPTEIYGHFKVSIDSYAKADDYEVAMLYLVNLKAGPDEVQKKLVHHYWYKSWPTYGVPKETHKIWKFLDELNNTLKDSDKPILFHCSAGIGRTAVFIGIDMGMREFKSSSKVDPLKYLCLLRKGRGGSIQTAEQYLYMHSVLSDFINSRSTTI
ncbi:Tyrosine-protein phosphatase non-receptor type 7-like [Oopsacas minuta]|uniref:Tyrosine-protein phosphatase non-receptor type 7-like n=1 Tax=Oopsacas minuta TaxID=111878 RepID=A0AAV7JWZ1_9METZ|nr:Tyrosine-protein phosphatase non-receptor type 7-like [Oopsacas minuta]